MSDFLMRLASMADAAPTSGPGEAPEPSFDARADALTAIRESGLFDEAFHRAANPDLADAGLDLLDHFVDFGWREGRRPNPYFDPAFYLEHNPDVAGAGMHPLLHYIRHGEAEGRQPCAVFVPAWYRARHGLGAGQSPLAHFLRHRHDGTASPMPAFDAEFYARNNPDVVAARMDPFEHYINAGWREGRDPSPDFDARWYAKRYLAGNMAENPFFHWAAHRDEPGVHGRLPEHETSIPREVKRWTRPAPEFEEVAPLPPSAPRQAKVLAYYLPQFHAFAENDQWWGKGFTEWTNLPRGLPRFAGHYQPRVPRDLGFYGLDERDGTETLRRQARMARDAGVHGFVFYYYWFNGKRLMDGPLERLLADPTVDLPFALMWANENWTRRWDGQESEVLISQDYREEDDAAMLADFARHFADPRYIRAQGRPLLFVYRPGIIPDCAARVERWRAMARERFGEDPLFVMAQAFGATDPRGFGMDGAVEFPPHKLTQHMPPANQEFDLLDPEFTGKIYRYEEVVRTSVEEAPPDFPLIKCACPSWDNDARRQGSGLVMTGSTPAKYQEWLSALIAQARRHPAFGEPFVCVNAWNEWCEGTYLEPDLHWGAAYLNATSRAVAGLLPAEAATRGLLLVGHDAFPAGAQALLLSIGRQLRRAHGLRVEFLLLDGGAMEAAYREVAPLTVLTPGTDPMPALKALAARGFGRALVNTGVAGAIAPFLEAAGIAPEVLLVHELPRLLRERNLVPALQRGFRHAANVVFPARFVERKVIELVGEAPAREALVLPQGSYKALEAAPGAAADFRAAHGIPLDASLALGVGYADLRKGLDLFLQVWRLANAEGPVHFLWAGGIAAEMEAWLGGELEAARAAGTFHTPGQLADIAPAFAAADVFLLTSREDPFPTVALEAMSLGRRVIAFRDSGGIPEMLEETGLGDVVPYADTVAMAAALRAAVDAGGEDPAAPARAALVRERFAFAPYVTRLLGMALPGMARVSVAVPNYNYARYMPERLGSVFRQTHPVHEVLVLDDVSKDDSLDVIPRIAAEWGRDIRLVPNAVNSGSVFAQWRKAAEMATGDWLWIAEADDTSEPAFVERLMAQAGDDPRVVMAFSDSRAIGADGSHDMDSYKDYYAMVEPGALTRPAVYEGAEFISRFLSVRNLILNVSAVIWRREALLGALDALGDGLRGFRMAGDWQLYIQALGEPGARAAYEAAPLNVHRRHAQSVTHALDAGRHLEEIARCHAFARARSGGGKPTRAQAEYLREVTEQLRPAPSTKKPPPLRRRPT